LLLAAARAVLRIYLLVAAAQEAGLPLEQMKLGLQILPTQSQLERAALLIFAPRAALAALLLLLGKAFHSQKTEAAAVVVA
jgi:hypothetical protein